MNAMTSQRLAADIRASLREALDYTAGKRTKAVLHKVTPRSTDVDRDRQGRAEGCSARAEER
jgi:hypothetical protein